MLYVLYFFTLKMCYTHFLIKWKTVYQVEWCLIIIYQSLISIQSRYTLVLKEVQCGKSELFILVVLLTVFHPYDIAILQCFINISFCLIHSELYGLSHEDLIFVSSPQTFDPFMIDVCLAIKYGCCLVMTNNDIRCSEDRLLNTIFPVDQTGPQITIMQTTPSLFMRWPTTVIRTRIFSEKSQLKILSLGGEAFPSADTVASWSNLDGKCRIFNLYGLTEMSCWASFYEITKSDVLNRKIIPIGNPIDQHTFFEVDSKNELIIKSKLRKCFQPGLSDDHVCDSTFEFVLNTGDRVNVLNKEIFFHSRLNSLTKFYGQKIDLNAIELLAKNVNSVEEAVCIYEEINKSFILFVRWNETKPFEEIHKQIAQAISCATVWITIQPVERFPLTAHGKIDKKSLLHDLKSCKKLKFENTSMIHIFSRIVSETLGCSIDPCRQSFDEYKIQKRSKTINDSSFKSLGGSSLKAIQIIELMEKELSWSRPELLPMLLNEQCTITDIFDFLIRADIKSKQKKDDVTTDSNLKYRWRINTNKCVDATPTICILENDHAIVSVGSHSKMLYNILIANGQILSEIELPDRIESEVTQLNNLNGIVGCYDGCLYCFEFSSGVIKWKFNSGGMIKCRALLIGSFAIFGNYNMENNLWCVHVNKGQHIWSCRIGLKSIYADPVDLGVGNFLASTLEGEVVKMSATTKCIFWTFHTNCPIFASPVVVKNEKHNIVIFVAGVSGTIYCLNESGDSVSNYHINGNIFTTFEIIQSFMEYSITKFIFGSQNHFLYMLSYNHETCQYETLWKRNMNASIRSAPIQFEA